MEKVLDIQIGGSHYKNMPFQPVELFAKTRCTAFQANIWKYISRHRAKNGRQDVEKCIHYAKLAKELKCYGQLGRKKILTVHRFCCVNRLSENESAVVKFASLDLYDNVIKECEYILEKEYSVKKSSLAKLKNVKK